MAVNEILLAQAEEIRDETNVGANTAGRVGDCLVGIVNELGNKADGDLSEIAADISAVKGKINEVIAELAGIAFVGAKPSLLGDFAWDDTVRRITLADGVEHLELSGTLIGTTFTGTISVIAADASTHGLPFPEDVTATMLGADKAVTYDEVTGAITINGVTADVEITAIATELHGVNSNGDAVRWRMGKYFSNNSSQTPSQIVQTSADGAFSDYIPASFVAGDVLEFDLGKYCFVANDYTTNPYIEFYGSDKSYLSHIGMNSENARSWTIPSGNNVLNAAYIRVSAYVPRIGAVYVKKNNSYYFKGDNL